MMVTIKKQILLPALLALMVLLAGCAGQVAAPPVTQTGEDAALPVTGGQDDDPASPAPTTTDVHRKGLLNIHPTDPPTQATAAGTVETVAAGSAGTAAPAAAEPTSLAELPATAVNPVSTNTAAPTNTSLPPTAVVLSQQLNPDQWKTWPEMPTLAPELKALYQRGLEQGNDPHAFSILGDCQSQPDVFMGPYDSNARLVQSLSPALQGTIANFKGSFNRYSPTVKDGTTEGALLWAQWNDNKEKKCNRGETPIDCELRTHRPSIVFIHIGTHWEARNRQYLETILQKIEAHGAVPILVTKADNREKDERVNHNLASLAQAYNLPLWNFWSTVQHLPDNGLKPGSDMYLNDEAVQIHRLGALRALDAVWRALQD